MVVGLVFSITAGAFACALVSRLLEGPPAPAPAPRPAPPPLLLPPSQGGGGSLSGAAQFFEQKIWRLRPGPEVAQAALRRWGR
mmetsp:Transcript_53180/g.168860  ORF Transcript_53180/g.168860 Transcript_53180/m.168860 type:complete len:83 (+) Transcript_53180:65-313(+)